MTFALSTGGAGARRCTEAVLAASRLADGFCGLPAGVTRWRLAAALRRAGARLGLGASALRLLEHYIDLTYDADWERGSEPIVTRPLVEIAEHLGRSERQVRNIERTLMERGLLAWRDSGNHQRRGRRDRRTGRLVYAYGPTLAPLGARAEEIIAAAEAAGREAGERRALRLAISATRRELRALLTAAEEAGEDLGDVATAVGLASGRERAGENASALAARLETLRALSAKARRRLDSAPSTAKEEISNPPTFNTTPETKVRNRVETTRLAARGAMRPDDIALVTAIAASRSTLTGPLATEGAEPRAWVDLIEAGRRRTLMLGIDPETWGEACVRIGREQAALCAIVVDGAAARKPGEGVPLIAPKAYFRALLDKADRGTLRLGLSIRALARRSGGAQSGEWRGADVRPSRSSRSA